VYDFIVTRTGTLIAATDELGVFSSTDGGMTWTQLSVGVHHTHNSSIVMDNDGNIFFGSPPSGVLRSDDGFDTFSITNAGLTDTTVMSLATSSSGYLYAGTEGGIVFRSVNPTTIVSVEEHSIEVPSLFLLEQNYPNPFNPSTTIKYALPKSSMVRLSVYDLLGREVTVLVNERREAGVHEARFDASGLASGVYLYRLQTGDVTHTKRSLLLR